MKFGVSHFLVMEAGQGRPYLFLKREYFLKCFWHFYKIWLVLETTVKKPFFVLKDPCTKYLCVGPFKKTPNYLSQAIDIYKSRMRKKVDRTLSPLPLLVSLLFFTAIVKKWTLLTSYIYRIVSSFPETGSPFAKK